MSVSKRVKNATAAAGLALLSLSFAFNSAAARPADDMLPAPAPITTPVDESGVSADAKAQPELKVVAPLTQAERDAALGAAFVDLLSAITAKEQGNPYYDAAHDNSLGEHVEKIAQMVRDGASTSTKLPEDVSFLGERGMSAFDAAIGMAVMIERPDLMDAFLEQGVDLKASGPGVISAVDRILIIFSQTQRIDRSMTESALEVFKKFMAAGVTFEDAKMVARQLRVHTLQPLHLVGTLMGADVLLKAGLIDSVPDHYRLRLNQAEQEALKARTHVDDAYLQSLGAPLVTSHFAALMPGAPFEYKVVAGDNLWDIAKRFRGAIGGADMNETLRRLAAFNTITIDERNSADRVLKIGETLRMPMVPEKRLMMMQADREDALIGVVERIRQAMGDQTTFQQALNNFIQSNEIKSAAELQAIINAPEGRVFKYTVNGQIQTTTSTAADALQGFVLRNVPEMTAMDAKARAQFFKEWTKQFANYNDFKWRDLLSGKAKLAQSVSYRQLVDNDTITHYDRLNAPESADPDNRVDLIVIEGPQNVKDLKSHGAQTYSMAVAANYAINPTFDMARVHAWNGQLPDETRGLNGNAAAQNALRILLNLQDTPLQDRLIFSYSMARYVPHTNGLEHANGLREDQSDFESMRAMLDDIERARPIIFAGAGNWRQAFDGHPSGGPGTGNFAQNSLLLHSPRSYVVGAAGTYSGLADKTTMSHYSDYGGNICTILPFLEGQQQEGTSFATPNLAGITRQMVEWYGNVLSFEEIMAAGMMVASQDVMDFDPFGGVVAPGNKSKADDASFYVNGGGVPIHPRCGSGVLDREAVSAWNETLKIMVEKKQTLERDNAPFTTSILEVDAPDTIEQATRADGTIQQSYIYKVRVPENLTLDKLTFLLPQFAGEKGDVQVTMPSGFAVKLPRSLNDVISTRMFNYEDVKKGDVIEIRTTQPLGQKAAIYLRGHADGNMIQVVRDYLRDKGVLHQPLQMLKGGVVQQTQLASNAKAPSPSL